MGQVKDPTRSFRDAWSLHTLPLGMWGVGSGQSSPRLPRGLSQATTYEPRAGVLDPRGLVHIASQSDGIPLCAHS